MAMRFLLLGWSWGLLASCRAIKRRRSSRTTAGPAPSGKKAEQAPVVPAAAQADP